MIVNDVLTFREVNVVMYICICRRHTGVKGAIPVPRILVRLIGLAILTAYELPSVPLSRS